MDNKDVFNLLKYYDNYFLPLSIMTIINAAEKMSYHDNYNVVCSNSQSVNPQVLC